MLSLTKKTATRKAMKLPLTSLLDMFTIILVFLMVSFQAEDKDFVLHAGVSLPESSAKSPFKTGVNMAITREAVLIEGKKVFELEQGGEVKEEDFESGRLEAIATFAKPHSALERALIGVLSRLAPPDRRHRLFAADPAIVYRVRRPPRPDDRGLAECA